MLHCFGVTLLNASLAAAPFPSGPAGPVERNTAVLAAGYGVAVAVGDGEVFVGEPRNSMRPGIVYIYRRDGTRWVERAQLKAADATNADGFGSALAVEGRTLIVGAATQNAVFVFQRQSNGAWQQSAKLTTPDGATGIGFGTALALRGDVLLAGAPLADERAGVVYAFRRDGAGNWTSTGRIAATDITAGDGYGSALAWDGNRAAIGAPGRNGRSGTVYLFAMQDGAWAQTAALNFADVRGTGGRRGGGGGGGGGGNRGGTLPTPDPAGFGSAIRLEADRMLVGAPTADNGTGAVFALDWDARNSRWQTSARLLPFDGQPAQFGTSMAMTGAAVWVGAPGADARRGAIYIFQQDSARGWTGVRKIAGSTTENGDALATTLAAAGDVIVAGATGADRNAGSATIFQRGQRADVWTDSEVMSPAESLPVLTGRKLDCTDGKITLFDCKDVDLMGFLPVSAIGGPRGIGISGMWGWTDPQTNHEYALVGRQDGAAFVDITDPSNPVYVGQIIRTEGANISSWREIKVYKDHAFIVSDGAGPHGIQIFDLTRLRQYKGTPITFQPDVRYDRVNSVHNIVINEETGFAYAMGSSSGGETCGGGAHMIDIRDPKKPAFVGCFADAGTGRSGTGYTHDSQCVKYHGPDRDYTDREICMSANETALSIQDMTDKANVKVIGRATYPSIGYTHQGWFTEDHRYFYLDDELDETGGLVQNTRTLVWDMADLDDPVFVKEFFGTTRASDHNLYIKGNLVYQSNYVAGLRILDISDPRNPFETAYFDTSPFGENNPGFSGSWSNYPFFKSGVVAVVSGREGLFILKKRETRPVS
jgi:choice-of-anchor B domain-containing protein